MNYMSAQTIMDNQNKYRYPVLIGNVNEERIGYDLVQKHQEEMKTPETEMKAKFNLQNSSQTKDLAERDKRMFTNICGKSKGQQAHVFFGHGFTNEDYLKRDFKTTNELAFGVKAKPQEFIGSKYYPGFILNYQNYYQSKRRILSLFKLKEKYSYQYQTILKANLTETIQKEVEAKQPEKKKYIHYDEFIKKFDATYMKTGLRK